MIDKNFYRNDECIILGKIAKEFKIDNVKRNKWLSQVYEAIFNLNEEKPELFQQPGTRHDLYLADNSPTFLNIGGVYTKQLLTVVIWSDIREKLKGKPELDYKNKNVCISGKIELYKGSTQIVSMPISGRFCNRTGTLVYPIGFPAKHCNGEKKKNDRK